MDTFRARKGRAMPPKTPAYRCQKCSGRADRAFVELNGKRHYLGRYGTSESRVQYHRLLAEWEARGGQLSVPPDDLTIVELCTRYYEYIQAHYRHSDGTPTGAAEAYRHALQPLVDLYGTLPADQFGPLSLKTVRQRLIQRGNSRSYVNGLVGKLKQAFKWAASEELIPASVYEALKTVTGLKRGRCVARETEAVRPAPEAHIDATRPYLSHQVQGLIDFQLYTGARPGEAVILRLCDIDRSGKVWIYRPPHHKTLHRGQERVICIGPRCQAVLRPFLPGRLRWQYIFSPKEAEAERRRRQHAERTTPQGQGNMPGSNRRAHPTRTPGERYTVNTYRRATTEVGQSLAARWVSF